MRSTNWSPKLNSSTVPLGGRPKKPMDANPSKARRTTGKAAAS